MLRELLPQGIVCVESALFHYGYSDFAPRAWSVAVPRTASRAVGNIVEFPLRAYYIQKEYFSIGKIIENFNGVMLPVYDREHTVCDCFKYRIKLDNEIFNKAIKAYVADQKKNIANLSKYAKEMEAFCKKIDTKTDDFGTVLKTIKEFLEKSFISAAGNKEFTEKWSAVNCEWM